MTGLARTTTTATTIVATTSAARWAATARSCATISVPGAVLTHAVEHVGAGRFGRCRHHVAAWRFAQATPDGLATHGQRLGFFTGLWTKAFDKLHGDVLFGERFDVLHEAFFVQTDKVDRLTIRASAAGAANAVHVVFTDVRDFVVDHVRQVVDINAACCNICSNQGTNIAALEAGKGLGAGALAFVAMQRHGSDAIFLQKLGHTVGTKLGTGKNQHLAPVVLGDDVRQQGFLFGTTDRVDHLRDALHSGVAWCDLNVQRVVEQIGSQIADFVAEGG